MSVKNQKRERAWNPRETMRNQRKQAGGEEQVNCPFVCSLTPARLPPLCSVVQGPPGRGLGAWLLGTIVCKLPLCHSSPGCGLSLLHQPNFFRTQPRRFL